MIDLWKIIIEYPSSIKDEESLKEILIQHYPNEVFEIYNITLAYRWGIITKIQSLENITIKNVENLAVSLAETGFRFSGALRVILQWMNAFGLEIESNIGDSGDMIVEGDPKAYILKNIDEISVEIKEFCGFDEKCIIIPSLIGGKQVIGIGKGAYRDLRKVEKIKISEGIRYIKERAFEGCIQLRDIIFPNSLEEIGGKEREDDNVNEYVNTCKNNIETQENEYSDPNMKLLSCYDKYDYEFLEKGVFRNTVIEHIILPDNVHRIGNGTFANMSELTSVKLPDELDEIPDYCFFNCYKLKSVNVPLKSHTIGNCAFKRCIKLETIDISKGVEWISCQAFKECLALRKVDIQGVIEVIFYEAFMSTAIEEIELPSENINIFDESVFSNCKKLKTVRMGKGFKSIPDRCFYECNSLENIELPMTIAKIGKESFVGCENLKKITIPSSVQVISESAFKNSGLEEVILKEGLFTLEQDCFADCHLSGNIVLPKTLTNIASNCFKGNYDINFLCYIGSEGIVFAKRNGFDYENAENR